VTDRKSSRGGSERLDSALVARGLAESRHKAQACIMAGTVFVDGRKTVKSGGRACLPVPMLKSGASPLPYVSRGGTKLEKALDYFGVKTAGRVFWTLVPQPEVLPTASYSAGSKSILPWMSAMAR